MVRLVFALILLCASLTTAVRPVQAGYEWCSVDPTLTFTRGEFLSLPGLMRTGVVDVQVLVPLSALPVEGVARLTVDIPSTVQGKEVLNTSIPLLFTLRTSFAPHKPATTTSPYDFDLELTVPAGEQAFPVRLLVTNLSTGEISVSDGMAGRPLRHSITIRD